MTHEARETASHNSTMTVSITEGEANFDVPAAGKPCKTWYKVFGDLSTTTTPLVTLHGGPGVSHRYLLSIAELATLYGIPVIFYDQIGIGNSTHLPERRGDATFWTDDLFCNELENLLGHLGIADGYDLLGHSWGGMFGSRFAARQPKGLKRLIISNSPASIDLWIQSANRLRATLPQEVQDILTQHEQAGTTESKAYQDAMTVFYDTHTCRLNPKTEDVRASFGDMMKDPTVFMTMNGPNEFVMLGTLKGWSVIDELHNINVPTLLINGHYDEAQDEAVLPFFLNIQSCKWVQFANSSHMPQWEEKERYLQMVGEFLKNTSSV